MIEGTQNLSTALTSAGVSVCHVCPDGEITLDPVLAQKLGLPDPCSIGDIVSRLHRRTRVALAKLALPAALPAQQRTSDIRFRSDAGEDFWLRVSGLRLSDHCAGVCTLVTVVDITDEREAIDRLRESEQHLRHTVEFNPQLPWIADPQGRIIDVTDRWLSATGMARETALGEGWLSVTHPDDLDRVRGQVLASLASGVPLDVRARLCVCGEYRWMRAQAYPRRDEAGEIMRWYGYTEDIHEHALTEERIRWNAEHDLLTGLANRAVFNDRLEAALSSSLPRLNRVGIILIDLDHFKEVNDLLGHHTGDQLLIDYAESLLGMLPPDALAARFGGDEFAVLLPSISDADQLLECADRLLTIRQSIAGDGGHFDCCASIGASFYPEHGRNSSELLRHADIALYAAKGSGRGKRLVFEFAMQHELRERAAMVSRARTAADTGDILAYYQPKVALATGELVGFEALLRWRDSHGQIHAPGSIAAAFDDPQVSHVLGQVMLGHVLGDMSAWQLAGLRYGHVAINAASAELRRDDYTRRLIAALRSSGLPEGALELEVTEGVFLGRGSDDAKLAIHQLHDQGIPIALDDFGTGFASLSHLRALPVSSIKIDRSFISDIAEGSGDKAIVSAIISLGANLGMNVIAEGIETQAQAETLRKFGCQFAQGYLFGRPTPAAAIPDLIRNWSATAARSVPPPLPHRARATG